MTPKRKPGIGWCEVDDLQSWAEEMQEESWDEELLKEGTNGIQSCD